MRNRAAGKELALVWAVFGKGCGWGVVGQVQGSQGRSEGADPCSDTPCVQYIVLLLYISQGDDESLTVFPEL